MVKRKRNSIRNHSAESALFMRRTIVVFLGILLAVAVLFTNLYYLQINSFDTYKTRSNANRISVQTVPPNRGLIYDRNGVILAENRPVYSLQVIANKANDLKNDIKRLTKLLSLTDDEIEKFNKSNRYSRSFKAITIRDQLTPEEVALFTVNQHLFKGFSIQASLKRYYPFGNAFTHVLGYIAKINNRDLEKIEAKGERARYQGTHYIGKLGIEKYYEDILHGQPGQRQVEVDSWGKVIRTLSFTAPTPGKDIKLNIDINLQLKAQELLGDNRGSIILMEAKTGAILSLVSAPSYDPNLFVTGISQKKYQALLESRDRPLINRATQGRYPPASTIKPQMALLALDEKVITEETKIYDPGWWIVPNSKRRFRDWKRWGHGLVDVFHAIEQSCDTFFYDTSYKLGIDRIEPFMRLFGFGEYSGLDLAEETKAIMPSRDWKRERFNQPWYDGDTISIGIGQGYWTVTPIQLTKATAMLARRGDNIKPHILQSIISADETVTPEYDTSKKVTLASERYWNIALEAMQGVTSKRRGTAYRTFGDAPYTVAGKSGTAQVINIKEDEVYDADKISERHRDNAMFIAFAPFESPEIVATVVLENAGGGSTNAAPIARALFDEYFKAQEQVSPIPATSPADQ
ncbi:penicillin-binding protein 2 [Psychromonas sp. 14N.309.X.WAT.B.A12]|uniref:penicillin-binding protein 2 n=1 Tax=Psychromonas sp. 14N.309.X.WAT.B.A12 TaxID=2998322 RepID=UPI0025B1FFDF|nr:penicillin-binding protein 2 [Psychromonas sp. 14N.309.X.WAT.B.A12]MDN2663679.1 penicillin-binding protein 2 [Psychromonas sp. 14N.309.X.WAT.B.A12]